MSKKEQVEQLTAYMANFVAYTAKVLPDDVIEKLDELAGAGKNSESPQLSGYRCAAVLGKMRNKISFDWRIRRTVKRCSCKGDF